MIESFANLIGFHHFTFGASADSRPASIIAVDELVTVSD